MKKIYLAFSLLLASCFNLFSEVPETLFMRGSALAESTDPMPMKRIEKDFPDSYATTRVQSNTYELITALKTGECEFAVTVDGEAVASKTITVDNTDDTLVPYRIRVNFDEETPTVSVLKIKSMVLWAMNKKNVITSFNYAGNSTFRQEPITYNSGTWGDQRYQFRLTTEDDVTIAYGQQNSQNTIWDDEYNGGAYDLWSTTSTEQWNYTINGTKYNTGGYKLRSERMEKPISMDIIFSVDKNYYHTISFYEEPIPEYVPEALFMKGSALAESGIPMPMKRIDKDFPESYHDTRVLSNTYELITALKTGDFEFSATVDGEVLASSTITVDDTDDLVPYRIRVNFSDETPAISVSKITQVSLWSMWHKKSLAALDYVGNSTFRLAPTVYNKDVWGDERYHFRVTTEDNKTFAYGQKTGAWSIGTTNETGQYDLWMTSTDGQWDYTLNGVKYNVGGYKLNAAYKSGEIDVKVIFSATENYTHIVSEYVPDPTTGISQPQAGAISIYPSLIENEVTVVANEEGFSAELFSATGQSVLKAETAGNTLTLSNLQAQKGIYIMRITKDGRLLGVKQVIKL